MLTGPATKRRAEISSLAINLKWTGAPTVKNVDPAEWGVRKPFNLFNEQTTLATITHTQGVHKVIGHLHIKRLRFPPN